MNHLRNCYSKRAYHSELQAEGVAEHQMGLHPGLVLRVYHCDICGKYHLTSKPPRHAPPEA